MLRPINQTHDAAVDQTHTQKEDMSTHKLTFTKSGAESWVSDWIAVGAAGFRVASLTLAWGAAADTAGELAVDGTDDPTKAVHAPITIDKSHGTWPNVGAAAAAALIVLSNCPGYIRLSYTRSGGGAADQFTAYATLTL